MLCEIIIPSCGRTEKVSVSDEIDNQELSEYVAEDFRRMYKLPPSKCKIDAYFDQDEDGLVNWMKRSNHQAAHGNIWLNGRPLTDFWVRAYEHA